MYIVLQSWCDVCNEFYQLNKINVDVDIDSPRSPSEWHAILSKALAADFS